MRARVTVLVLLIVLVTLQAGIALCDGEEGDMEFPYILRIAEGNVLFAHGYEYRDSVAFTYEPGDSLRIEGMAILPSPPFPSEPMSEENLAKTYARVPFIVERVEEGLTWREASEEWYKERAKILLAMKQVYWGVLDSTGSHDKASAAALAALDRSLLDPDKEPTVGRTIARIPWEGSIGEFANMVRHPKGEKRSRYPEVTLERATGYAAGIIKCLDGTYGVPWVVVLERRGRKRLAGGEAEEALQQIELAWRGDFIKGPLDKTALKEILSRIGGERR
jgi:hypothetical protein